MLSGMEKEAFDVRNTFRDIKTSHSELMNSSFRDDRDSNVPSRWRSKKVEFGMADREDLGMVHETLTNNLSEQPSSIRQTPETLRFG